MLQLKRGLAPSASSDGSPTLAEMRLRSAKFPGAFEIDPALRQRPNGSYYLKRSSKIGNIELNGRPAFLDAVDEKNKILGEARNSQALRKSFDTIERRATDATLDGRPAKMRKGVQEAITSNAIPAYYRALRELFEIDLELESRSTARYGGVMAGSFCNRMRLLQEVVQELNRLLRGR